MTIKKLSEYTESEFLELIKSLFDGNFKSEEELDAVVHELVDAVDHPDGTDILFYPSDDREDSPEGVLNFIKKWRAENGKPGFKE
ncbi:bacteriocin immunity protein [Yersinia alsatica]|uniref:Bacteriocin immunity protein n=1 Tax=Yersinia alsatica TaxID=2890317 RepID=A0ABY5URA1_9GAMM|nr:bacteriocin immunity protein [Yersinia alsatica]OWF68380.1 bacteriocin immunity protein [Yersinia frederiksenii]UWM45095.1 bacteriocin immunity protein [Yersinia alsatica]CNL51574.1 colicin-E2 immunity protein [Yersinia frederiksenii]CNL80895.1 colicin-E2 immunity protein [Yersinia frederiksenii]